MESSNDPMGPQLIEATYLMTRERAMLQAGDLEGKLGHPGFDQESLVPQMTQWLSRPVIKVLSMEMKGKVFIEDLSEYRYTISWAEPSLIAPSAITNLRKEMDDKLEAIKHEILAKQTENATFMRIQFDRLNRYHLGLEAERQAKRRAENQSSGSDIFRKLQKVHQGLCLLMTEDSELVHLFHDIAKTIDKDFDQKRSRPGLRETSVQATCLLLSMSTVAVDLTGNSPAISAPSPPAKKQQTPTPTPSQEQEQDPYFMYKKECRLAWIKYLGLLDKVRLRQGPDKLPIFHGMPPEYSTSRLDPEAMAAVQRKALSNPRNSLICIDEVLTALANRPQHTHIAWHAIQQKLTNSRANLTASIKHWEAMGTRNPMVFVDSTTATQAFMGRQNPFHNATSATSQTPSGISTIRALQPTMNRLVGIRGQEEDPAGAPGYVFPMASFEQAISRGEKEKNEITRRKWAEMALRALRKFMDSQKNEAIIDKMVECQKHYEALAALDKNPQGAK
ncbi:hypothetical protein FBEOM_1714 [Fusarium beomiforme]|uniref:Uncharacterized protein n=1 Tax=Fusarium beomiforme TaxID=44412 RepID=A0A9P5E2N4_9HYPO|nr:hypothetical protein FBEOM_1714 [Fusarium beomiforme]